MASKECYFGYGSNLGLRVMQERGAKVISRELAVLEGYRLAFDTNFTNDGHGWASLTLDPRSKVYGALYVCEEGSLASLDHVHIPKFWRETIKVTRSSDDELVEAVIYRAKDELIKEGLKPSLEYYAMVLEGQDILPANYVEFIKSFNPLN